MMLKSNASLVSPPGDRVTPPLEDLGCSRKAKTQVLELVDHPVRHKAVSINLSPTLARPVMELHNAHLQCNT